ncbi:TIGR02594 family protein [Rhodoplanes sp. Z2-YC6860]|uniref:TIGR02594 family protein n=1 Tax=Rhodoplanes sp. Z2-YC6860 TaxID=674703 RepID=UPI00082AA3EC|nr:TIGR02594 family protein [Rhodoplanes sp. Z2-YC6860]
MIIAYNQAFDQRQKTFFEKKFELSRKKISQLSALLAFFMIKSTAAANADVPESHVLGQDSLALTSPSLEATHVSLITKQSPFVKRGSFRSHAKHQLDRPVMRLLAVHEDGSNIVGGDVKTPLSTSIIIEARRWIGTNPTGLRKLWCANFMNFVLTRLGYSGTSSDMAQSFASYGKRLVGPEIGAIAVMRRGKSGGHVGVVTGFAASGNPIIISGNYTHRVAEAVYSRSHIYAYVAP